MDHDEKWGTAKDFLVNCRYFDIEPPKYPDDERWGIVVAGDTRYILKDEFDCQKSAIDAIQSMVYFHSPCFVVRWDWYKQTWIYDGSYFPPIQFPGKT